MLSRLIEQVEDQLHRLEKGAPTAAKSDITKATNLVKDANKSKLVSLCELIFVLCQSKRIELPKGNFATVNAKIVCVTFDTIQY